MKDPNKLEETKQLFHDFPINITVDGKRHLGASIGTAEFKNEYMDEKVDKWCKEIKTLAEFAKSQPHAAYAAFIHGEQHKFTYFLRTISNISGCLKPLDDTINDIFIPTLFGREITENERKIISMPIREGGLGLRIVAENADQSYAASSRITNPLVECIINQSDTLPDPEIVQTVKSRTITQIKELDSIRSSTLKLNQTQELQRSLEQSSEQGASSWLGALPIAAQGFNLNKGEFQDAICMRYRMPIKNLPSHCPCGKQYNLNHALNCHRGGFVNIRHDKLRDMECKLLKEVCNDVEREPQLQKVLNRANYKKTANLDDNARLDVRARGFWRDGQNAFFDVRVTNVDSESLKKKKLETVLRGCEQEKKNKYNRRVMEVEHGTFTPLVFTTSGVMSHECTKYHKALAEKLSEKKGEKYEVIMRYLRVKTSFLALKGTLLCLRGSRSITSNEENGEDFGFHLDELGLQR